MLRAHAIPRSSSGQRTSSMSGGETCLAELFGGDGTQPPGLVVVEGLEELVAGVHDERAVVGNRLTDREAAHDVDVDGWAAALLLPVSPDANRVASSEDGELPHAKRTTLGPDVAGPVE